LRRQGGWVGLLEYYGLAALRDCLKAVARRAQREERGGRGGFLFLTFDF
jgi:hypothetical protein